MRHVSNMCGPCRAVLAFTCSLSSLPSISYINDIAFLCLSKKSFEKKICPVRGEDNDLIPHVLHSTP